MIVEFPGEMLAVGIDHMGIHIGYHPALGMTGITLYCLNAAADFQFNARAAVAQAVKYNRLEIVFGDQMLHLLRNLMFFIRPSVVMGNDEMEVSIQFPQLVLQSLLTSLYALQLFDNAFRKINGPDAALRLRRF